MPSIDPQRRTFLGVLGGSLAAVAGCLGDDGQTPTARRTSESTATASPTATPEPTETATEQPASWPRRFDGNVVALDEDDGELFAVVAGDDEAVSQLLALELDGSVRWRTEFQANAYGGGPDEPDEAGREWSTWVTGETIYLAGGIHHEWWAVRAFDRHSGKERWSFQEERALSIRDVTTGSLLVTAEEIFVPETTHDTPADPLVSELYRVDRETGDATKLGERSGVRGATMTSDGAFVLATGSLTAFDNSGGARWQQSLAGKAIAVYMGDGRVVTVSENDAGSEIVGFDLAGERKWARRGPETYGADTLFVDGTVYVGGGDGVAAIRTDGTVAWRDSRPAGWFVHDDATGRLYTRSGAGADAVAAYGPQGDWLWTFDPASKNAWPTCVTDQAVLAGAITGEHADEPFQTVYAVDPETGSGSSLVELDTVFSAETVGNRAYLATDTGIQVFEPTPAAES